MAILVLLATCFSGTLIAKRGSSRLSPAQRTELGALGPDILGMVGIMGALLFGYFPPQLHIWSVIGAIACGALGFFRIPMRIHRQTWPRTARVLLVCGNVVLIGGAIFYAVLRAIPFVRF